MTSIIPPRPQACRSPCPLDGGVAGRAPAPLGGRPAAQLHSTAWVRLFTDIYADASLPVSHRLRALAATRLLLPGSVACGVSAATIWGLPLCRPDDDVHLVLPASCRGGAGRGLQVQRSALPPGDRRSEHGVPLTSPARTAIDLARTRPLDEAVALVDRIVASGVVDLADVRSAAAVATRRDCRHVRRVVSLADGLAGSPQETRLRLLLRRSALPPPVAQFTVRSGRVWVARVDFAWPEHRLALEYDGVWHGEPAQFAVDRERLNRLTAAGWRVVFATAADLRTPERLLARVAAALTV